MSFLVDGVNGSRASWTNGYVFTTSTRLSFHGLIYIPPGALLGNRTIFTKRLSGTGNYTFNFRIGTLTGENGTFGPNLHVNFGTGGSVAHSNINTATDGNVIITDLPVITADALYAVGCEIDFSDLTNIRTWLNGVKYELLVDPGSPFTIQNPDTVPSFGGPNDSINNLHINAAFSQLVCRITEDVNGTWPDEVFELLGGLTEPGVYASPLRTELQQYMPAASTQFWKCTEVNSPNKSLLANNDLIWVNGISSYSNPIGQENFIRFHRMPHIANYPLLPNL